MNRDEAIALVNGQFGVAIRDLVVGLVAPFFIATPEITSPSGQENWSINNGSCFFLDCGEGPFLVTADHIFQDYLSKKSKEPRTVCYIFNYPFEPEERLIDRNEIIDIATFRVSEIEINMVGVVDGKDLFPKNVIKGGQSGWPPVPPKAEDGIWFAGFPGRERLHTGHFELNFGAFTALTIINDVSERNISCHFDREFAVDSPAIPLAPSNYDMGGLSGAPLLVVGYSEEKLMSWHLGGVIYEANSDYEIVLASRADFILRDGNLKKPS